MKNPRKGRSKAKTTKGRAKAKAKVRLALYQAAAPIWLVGVMGALVPTINDLFSIAGVGAGFWLSSLGGLIHVLGVGGGKLVVRRPRSKSYSQFMRQKTLEATSRRGKAVRAR